VVLRRGQERRVLGAGQPLALAPSDVIELGDGTKDGAPAELRVHFDADPEVPRVFEVRPISKLVGGAVAAKGDPVLRTLCELQRAIGAADELAAVLEAVADAALVLVPRATHATLVLREELGKGPDESPLVPVLTRVRGDGGSGMTPTSPVRVARSVFRKVV